eukprot:scaffold351_cov371-Prasinococcus_capsulatus_cf.AAC.13
MLDDLQQVPGVQYRYRKIRPRLLLRLPRRPAQTSGVTASTPSAPRRRGTLTDAAADMESVGAGVSGAMLSGSRAGDGWLPASGSKVLLGCPSGKEKHPRGPPTWSRRRISRFT